MLSPEVLQAISVDRIRRHIQELEGVRHPLAAPEALERAADTLAGAFGDLGFAVEEHSFPAHGRSFRNIIATHRGSVAPDRRVIVLAHYDTVAESPGADDNTSGVAVLLELARVLQPLTFERSIQFIAVSLEENQSPSDPDTGLCGSRALAAHARANAWCIEGVVVLESVAYAGAKVVQTAPAGVPVAVPSTGDFLAVVANADSQELLAGFTRSLEQYRIDLPHLGLAVPGNGKMLPDSRRSDHASFWDQGYRAVMLTDTTNFRNPNYHQPTDTLETLNLEFAAQVCRATAGLVAELACPVAAQV